MVMVIRSLERKRKNEKIRNEESLEPIERERRNLSRRGRNLFILRKACIFPLGSPLAHAVFTIGFLPLVHSSHCSSFSSPFFFPFHSYLFIYVPPFPLHHDYTPPARLLLLLSYAILLSPHLFLPLLSLFYVSLCHSLSVSLSFHVYRLVSSPKPIFLFLLSYRSLFMHSLPTLPPSLLSPSELSPYLKN